MTAIVAGDIITRYTVTTGAAGDSVANTTVSTFLGKYAATSIWTGGSLNDLFPDISGAQNAASQVDYAGLAVLNNNASNILQNAVAYISAETALGAVIAIGADTTAASAKGAAGAQLVTIASSTTAPAGASFSAPTTLGTGIALGAIGIAQVKGLWIRRTASASAALSADGFTLAVAGDTGSL